MPRGAQVIYPKDLAPICMLADIGPGVRVFESGVGSGALSMTMLRWGADDRRLRDPRGLRQPGPGQRPRASSARRRWSATRRARATATRGSTPRGPFDRVVLDLPEPWQVVPHDRARCDPGHPRGLHAVDHAGGAARERGSKGRWNDARTLEVLHRGWHIDGQAVRPDHRMVAHTGVLDGGHGSSAEQALRPGGAPCDRASRMR